MHDPSRDLNIVFGTREPRIALYPHIIIPASADHLRRVAESVGTSVGVWGNAKPLYNQEGGPYLEPPDGRILEDFVLWEQSANQEYALSYGGRLCGFNMAIPSDTSIDVLRYMYDSNIGNDDVEYDKCMFCVADWIDRLGWAYIPLEPEGDNAMFVAASYNAILVKNILRDVFSNVDCDIVHIVHSKLGFQWRPIGANRCQNE